MALFQNNNNHSGALRTPHEKPGFIKYTGVYLRHFWELLRLNLLYIIACIPIITIGPATAAMTKLCRNYYQERHVYIWTDFWKAFKDNFKQGMFFWHNKYPLCRGLFCEHTYLYEVGTGCLSYVCAVFYHLGLYGRSGHGQLICIYHGQLHQS